VADLARRGSGSAPRSLLGGFVELPAGAAPDGSDALPRTILGPDAWDVRLVVALAGTGPKAVGSTEGMERTRRTSPYYEAWLALCREHLPAAADAVRARDLGALGPIVEASARAMHAAALAADPPVAYWTPVTLALLACVRGLRDRGVPAWATIDAGPHVKVLCAAGDAPAVAGTLAAVPRVVRVFEERPGAAAEGMDGCA
jgi:diphosphomevalonate decarboxylase